jgi:large subunit ribosomal protein L3
VAVGILGTKVGMTQVFDEQRQAIPVTVIQAGPCPVTQIKTKQTDGYQAIQVAFGEVSAKGLTRPELKHLEKAGVAPMRHLQEYHTADPDQYQLGQEIKADVFEAGQLVDVTGASIGRGFAGYQKRHNFKRGPMAHGSTGAGTTPGRVFPGKRMAGQLGDTRTTVRKLTVFRVDTERNLILVRGSVPGKPGALVSITPATIVGKK